MHFNDREKAFEDKFALDEEIIFKVRARRNKQAALWAAGKMGYDNSRAEIYADEIVKLMPSKEELHNLISNALMKSGANISNDEIFKALDDFAVSARRHIMENQ